MVREECPSGDWNVEYPVETFDRVKLFGFDLRDFKVFCFPPQVNIKILGSESKGREIQAWLEFGESWRRQMLGDKVGQNIV